MTITAKHSGWCAKCRGEIKPGDKIEWNPAARPGEKTRHEQCPSAAKPTPVAAPPAASRPLAVPAPVSKPAKKFAPTDEQRLAQAAFSAGKDLAIEAGSGAGKTSTMILLAQSTPRRGQFVAFNKAITQDAAARVPSTVNCSTAHSLAFRAVGHTFKDRLFNSRRMRSLDIANMLGIEQIAVSVGEKSKTLGLPFLGGLVMSAVTLFCQSADKEPLEKHVPHIEAVDDAGNAYVRNMILPYVRAAWVDLMNPNGRLPYKHDHYLKFWAVNDPRIAADYILFDEAQDASPVMLSIVQAQTHAQKVFVGDSQQAINSFMGAVNALDRIREMGGETLYLRQSFRFGNAVADVANTILAQIPSAAMRITGTPSIPSVVGPVAAPKAILCRTNATAVRTVMRLQAEGRVASLVGGGDDVVTFARAAGELMEGRPTEHRELACFSSWSEVQTYISEDAQGSELRLLAKLVDDFGVPAILAALGSTIREEDADVIVSTAHKSKGREWDSVQLAGDFPPPEKMDDDERRLLYVAVTRAQLELDIEAVEIVDPRAVTTLSTSTAPAPATVVSAAPPPPTRCVACNRPLRASLNTVRTRDGQHVQVGPDCFQFVLTADATTGYRPTRGGQSLFALEGDAR